MKISVGMRIYISSSASIDLSAGDDIPKELLEKVPVIFRTTAVEYDKRRFMGNLRATNDLEISYSSSGIVIIKKGELIPDAVLDKVPDSFKTSGVIPPAPSAETNAKNIAINKTDIANLDKKATKMTSTATSAAPVGEVDIRHWITVASSVETGGEPKQHCRVIVSEDTEVAHSFIEIDWLRTYNKSSFNILNMGGRYRKIEGARVLAESADLNNGKQLLQIQTSDIAILTSQVISEHNSSGWSAQTAVAPIVEDNKTGYVTIKIATKFKDASFVTSDDASITGDLYTRGALVGLDKAKCYIDMDPEDFPGDRNTYGRVGLSAIKYQSIGNHFDIDVNTNEIIIKKQGHYNLIVVINHTKGASTGAFSNAQIYKNGSVGLGGGSAGNVTGWYSLVVRALGENLVNGDRICVKANGRNDNSYWSTFSIEEI